MLVSLRARALALTAALGVALGALANLVSVNSGGVELSLPGAFVLFGAALGGLALYLARQVVKFADRQTRQEARNMNPLMAARVAVFAQALALTGAFVAGWQVSIGVYQLGLLASRSSLLLLAETGLALLGGLAMLVCGLVAESWCKIPPGSDDEGGTPTGRLAQTGPLARSDKG